MGERIDCLLSILGYHCLMPARPQQSERHAAIDFVVFDQEYASRLNLLLRCLARRLLLGGRVSAELTKDLIK